MALFKRQIKGSSDDPRRDLLELIRIVQEIQEVFDTQMENYNKTIDDVNQKFDDMSAEFDKKLEALRREVTTSGT